MSSLMRCINVTARCATLRRSEQLFPVGLTGGQHTYVLNICRNPGITQDQLAKMIYINKSNVARQVAQLEQAGFIERRVDKQDKRQMLLYPTQKAKDALPAISQALKEWNDYLNAEFTEDQRIMLEQMMEKVMNRAKAFIDAQPGREGSAK